MFDFLKDKTADKSKREFSLIEVACLLIHASKIDQNYTEKEKEIVKKTLLNFDTSPNEIEKIIIMYKNFFISLKTLWFVQSKKNIIHSQVQDKGQKESLMTLF